MAAEHMHLPAQAQALMSVCDTLNALRSTVNQASAVAYAMGALLPEGGSNTKLAECGDQIGRSSAMADAVGELLGTAKTQINLAEETLAGMLKEQLGPTS